MSLEIHEREREGITILDLVGKLVAGDEVASLRADVQRLAAAGSINIILNCKSIQYIDSSGLGQLVVGYTTLKKAGGAMCLLNVRERNLELLILTKLATVFQLFDDEQDAVNSYFPDRHVRHFDILSFVEDQSKKDKT
jgi:anti-sigma B factor antagonist